MLLFILLTFILSANGNSTLLNTLIERIHNERKIHTVYTIGDPPESTLRNSDFPKVLLTSIEGNPSDVIEYDKNVLLLVLASAAPDYLTQGTLDKLMELIVRRRFVIIQADNLYDLEIYFSWFWTKKFSRIFGITRNKTYAYLPFADCTTQLLNNSGPIPDVLRDLNGYGVRTSIRRYIPSVFRYKDKSGNPKLGGAAAQIFFGFIQKYNATYIDVPMKNSLSTYFQNLNKALDSNKLDMTMLLHPSSFGLLTSYPVRFLRYEIVVPYNGYIPANEYFIRPFKISIWIAVAVMFPYLVFAQVFGDYFINRKLRIWQIYSQVVCTSIGTPTGRITIGPYRLYILTYVFFFILDSLYLSRLTSFLTVFIESSQFNTFQDIIDTNLKILVDNVERDYIKEKVDLPQGFESHLIGVPSVSLANGWFQNRSFGYISTSEKTDFLLSQQTYLKQPLFRVCDEFLTHVYLGFVLQKHSPFYDTCNRYVMEILQSGLVTKWVSDSFYQGREAGILKMLHDEDQPLQPLTLRHFTFPGNCYIFGLLSSFVVFIGEMALKYFARK